MKHKLSLVLSLGLAITFAGIGCALLPVSAEEVAEPVMENILQTVEGYKEAGAAQIRTTEKLTGEYSVTYSTTGVTPNNGWIAQQFIGLDEEGTFLQVNLFVDNDITVSKMKDGNPIETLPILNAETGEPMSPTRTLEVGGDWFNGPEYIFKYEVTKTRLNLYFGYASKIVEGTDAPISRAYVELDEETFEEFTDGFAAFAPYYNGFEGYSMTVNSVSVNGKKGNLDLSSMTSEEDPTVVANDTITVFHPELLVNYASMSVDFSKDGGAVEKRWVSELPVNSAGLPDAADVFVTSFEINLVTNANNYVASGLQFGMAFGLPEKDSATTEKGVTSITGKLPMAGLDISVGDGTATSVKQTVGDANKIFSAQDSGMSTLFVSLIGKKDGSLTISYRTDAANDTEVTATLEGLTFDGYLSFWIEANNVTFGGGSTSGILTLRNIRLPSTEKVEAESISLSEETVSVRIGESKQLTAEVKPDNTTIKSVTWTSSDSEVATVDENGLVTAVASGSAVITATTENGLQATCSVLVPVEAESVSLDKTEATVSVGRTLQLKVTVSPETATDKSVTWKSSNEKIATVDKDGLVTGVSSGEATITVTTTNGKTAECRIIVSVPVESVTLDKEAATLETGETLALKATVRPENAGNKAITWSSSAENVASVDENGLVTAKAAGEAVITVVTADGYKEASCTVTVTAPVVPVTKVTLNKSELALEVGGAEKLSATIEPGDATDKSISWKSSDESVAVVDKNGVVTALKAGTTTVTVTTADGNTATCKVTVSAKSTESSEVGDDGCGSVFGGTGIAVGAAAVGVILSRKKKRD